MRTESAFWETSAIVTLCCVQVFSLASRRAYRGFPKPVIWWGTPVEIQSAFRKLNRLQALNDDETANAIRLWASFRTKSRDVVPDNQLLRIAEKIPATYTLRALDAFQLAAAMIWCGERPRNRPFITADNRLGEAARDAGFDVVSLA